MKTLTIKALFNIIGNPFVLDPTMTYPTIEESDANFLEYYNDNKENLDRMFVHDFGQRLVDLESDSDEDIADEWEDEIKAIQQTYLENWARLWYALSEPYNPLYNVDGTEVTVYGQHQTDRSNTYTQHEDSSTQYSVSYDSALEKETGKQVDNLGAHTDTGFDKSLEHTDTVTRQGNIGVTKSTELLRDEMKLRTEVAPFFKVVFQTMIEEIGGYYECNC
jgi:hypothetical protein